MDCSPPGSSVHGILQTRILEWVAISFSNSAGDPGSIPGLGRSPGEWIGYPLQCSWVCLVAQMVKNPPAMWETWVWSQGWEDPLKEGRATHSYILAWRIPRTEEPGGLQSMGTRLQRLNAALTPWLVSILIRRENRGAGVDTEEDWSRGGSDASPSQRVPATTRNWRGEEGSSPGRFRNSVALPTPWFRSLSSRTGRGYFPDVLSHLVCGPSLSLLLLCFLSISAEQEALNRLEKKLYWLRTSQALLVVKDTPARTKDTRDVGSILGWEDSLEKGIGTHSSIHAGRIPWAEEPSRLQSMGSQRARHDWVCTCRHIHHLVTSCYVPSSEPEVSTVYLIDSCQ